MSNVEQTQDLDGEIAHMREELVRVSAAHATLEAALRYRFDRSLLERILFRPSGRPKRPVRRLLFHASGKPRGIFRQWVIRPDGQPRDIFAFWMHGEVYARLPWPAHSRRLPQAVFSDAIADERYDALRAGMTAHLQRLLGDVAVSNHI